jgi:hypothetical protein
MREIIEHFRQLFEYMSEEKRLLTDEIERLKEGSI